MKPDDGPKDTSGAQSLSVAQAAKFLGIGRSSVFSEIRAGKLPAKKIGRRTIILRKDVDDYLNSLPPWKI